MNHFVELIISPVGVTFLTFALLGLLLVIYGIMRGKATKRKSILQRLLKKPVSRGLLDEWLDKLKFLNKSEQVLDQQLSVLDMKIKARTFTKARILAAFLGVLLALYLKNWLAVLPLAFISIQFPTMVVHLRVNRQLKAFNDQVLESFQIFITDYTTTRSVHKTLMNIIPKLRDPLRKEYERLSRRLNSGVAVETAFMEFAERTQNKWIMIFSQMIITYYRQGGDFSEHLMKITQSIVGEKILEEQNSTELATVSTLNYILNALTPLAFVVNRWINPGDAAIFTDTTSGKMIVFFVCISTIISLLIGRRMSTQ